MGHAKADSVANWSELSPGFVYSAGRLGDNNYQQLSKYATIYPKQDR